MLRFLCALLFLSLLMILCSQQALVAVELRVTDIDGKQHLLSQLTFDEQHIGVPDLQLPLDQVSSIEATDRSMADEWSTWTNGMLLQDASWIPLSALVAAPEDDVLQLATPFGVLQIPLEYVAAWGAYEELPAAAAYDYLILKNGNKPYGELMGLSAGKILLQTDLSDEPLHIPLEDIRALRLRTQKQTVQGLHVLAYTHPRRAPMKLLPGRVPRLALVDKVSLSSWDGLARLEIMGGKRRFLAASDPSAVDEKGLFGKVWPHSINKNIDGSPLYLNAKRYEYGMVLHSYAKISWPIPAGKKSFRCLLGISDLLGREGNCAVRIFADDKELWFNPAVRGDQKAHDIDLDISAAKTLTIEVDYGERYDIGDHVLIANPFFY